MATARRVAPDLLARELRVPQLDDRQRDQATVRARAPLVEHPVVVRLDAQVRELHVLGFHERLPAKARERRERQRRLDPVDVHVLEARLRVETTRAHLLIRDRSDLDLVTVEPDGRTQPRLRDLLVLVMPPVAGVALALLVREVA